MNEGTDVRPDLQLTMRGAYVELRPLRAEDWEAVFAVASDPLIWEQHPERERYREDIFREFFRVALETGSAYAVIDRADGRVIGSTRYHGYDEEKSEIEIGWTFLARSHWGGRYNGEMKRLMLEHAFGFVENVVFVVGVDNIRSQTAVQRIGGVLAGPRIANGRESVEYRIRKDQYRTRQRAGGPANDGV